MEKTGTLSLRTASKAISPLEVKEFLSLYNFSSRSVGWNQEFSNEDGSFVNDVQDNGDGTLIDKNTSLMWQQGSAPSYTKWQGAKEFIRYLNQSNFAGYSDWRLPTIEELASLIMAEQMKGDLYVNPQFSDKMWFWSCDTVLMDDAPREDLVWTANFHYGSVYWLDKDQGQDVKAVRSMIPVAVESQKSADAIALRSEPTDLSNSDVKEMLEKNNFFSKDIDWNSDYSNESGTYSGDLYDNHDGTITDKSTNLLWQRGSSPEYCRWYDAQEYIDYLNSIDFAGYNDWRLPTVEEFASLMRATPTEDGVYIDPLFSNRMWFWCCDTRDGVDSGFVWTANFHYGTVFSLEKNQGHDVRAVRSL